MSKRYLYLFFLCTIFPTFSFPQNNQTLVPASSIVYEYLRVLTAEQKEIPRIAEKPASKAMILDTLEQVEYNDLAPSSKRIYEELLHELKPRPFYSEPEGMALDVEAEINLETYYQGDYKKTEWQQQDSSRLPFLNFPVEGWFSHSLYARFDLTMRKVPFLYEVSPSHDGRWINVPVNMAQLDYQFPPSAYIAAGGPHWGVQLGRDTLSYGSGRTGNFLISDEIPYFNFVRARTDWDAFSFFYTAIDLEPRDAEQSDQRYLFSHGFMLNFIPRLRITIKESSLLADKEPSLTYINPLYMFHNWYLESSNSILTVDAELNLMKGVNLYGVLAVDQLKTFFEQMFYSDNYTPDAFGYLLGTEVSLPFSEGYWLGNIEWVYTNPWLYIHEENNADLVWTGNIESNVDGAFTKTMPLGYPSGPDSMLLHSSLSYMKPRFYRLGGGYSFQLKGEQSIDTEWDDTKEAFMRTTPTGTAETTHALWCNLTWYPRVFTPLKEIGTGLTYLFTRNEKNIEGSDAQDLQWSVRFSVAF